MRTHLKVHARHALLWIVMFHGFWLKAQNPNTITLLNQQSLSADETKRASTKILLQAGFKYGQAVGANRLTLQISPYPPYVGNGYANPSTSCGVGTDPANSLVGETAGSFGVSPAGQATYNIPITVSPGTAGMQPNLALAYVSGAGCGIAGEGFNLLGLPAITRAPKTPYLDGKYEGINLNNADGFALNGSRLILVSGSNGANGSQYATEIESFATVSALSVQGNGPERFTVMDKSGTLTEYGGTADSRLKGTGDNTVLAWLVSKITDESGNYMLFSYRQLDGEAVIDHIDYTGNLTGGLMPYAQVSFDYMSKTEKNRYYVAGKEFNTTQLLKSITCTYEGTLAKKYRLDYIFDQHTLLKSVTEINADGTELKPTEFCWSNPANNGTYANMQSAIYPANSPLYSQIKKIIPADLNGDGLTDMVSIRTAQVDYIRNNYMNFYGGSSSSVPFTTDWTNSLPVSNPTIESSSAFDINFDNKQEVYFIQSDGNAKKYDILKVTETGLTTYGSYSTSATFASGQTPSRFYFDQNDYTGDGEKEILIIDPEKISVSGISGSFSYAFGNTTSIAKPCDFDGDGVMDVMVVKNNGNLSLDISILKLGSSGFVNAYSQSISFTGNSGSNDLFKNIGLGDFNADGKTDLLYLFDNKQTLYIRYSDGNAFLSPKKVDSFTPLVSTTDYNLACPDFSGDGYSDLIITNNTGMNVTNYQTYFSVGNMLIKGITTSGYFNYNSIEGFRIIKSGAGYKVVNETIRYASSYQFQIDFNGDGKIDLISLDPAAPKVILSGAIDAEERNIVRIGTGLKKQIDIYYSNTATRINHPREEIYSDATNSYSGNLASINPGLFVVDKVYVGNSNTQFQTRTQYFYQGAIFHKKGKGFMGFESSSSFDMHTRLGSTATATVSGSNLLTQNAEQLTGTYSTINTGGKYIFSRSSLISREHTDFQTTSLGSGRYFMVPSSVSTVNYLDAHASSVSNTYDLAKQGNLSSFAATYGWPGQPTIKTENGSYTYTSVNGRWRLQAKTLSGTQAGEPAYSRSSAYSYDGQGRLTSVTNDPTFGTQSLQTSYQNYNAFGLATKSTVSAGDITTRSSESSYDGKGRFVVQTKNALLQTESFVYDPLYGTLVQKTDISGLISKFKYDGIGRLIETRLPDNTTNKVEYSYDNDGGYPNPTIWKKKVQNEGEAEIVSYYDSFGRLMKTLSKDAMGNVVITNNAYDSYGVLEYSFEPHYASQQTYLATKYIRETAFYRMSRAETVKYTAPTGPGPGTYASTGLFKEYKYSNILSSFGGSYAKAFVQIADNTGKVVKKEYNAARQNNVIANGVPDPFLIGGTQITQTSTYSFHSNGKPKTVVLTNDQNANTITHSFAYDQLGQQSQMVDPSAGTVTYTYSTLGELLHQSDANGTWDYAYDALGRMNSKTGSQSGTTSYQYVSSGNGLNQIKKITGPAVVTEYTYDNLGRNTQFKESTGTKAFVTDMAYDTYGRLKEYKYPGGYVTRYTYGSSGALSYITDASNQIIWQLDEVNSLGQLSKYSYGNGIQTVSAYDGMHKLDAIEHGTIHKQDYTFDPLTGNLTSREFFNYDPAHSSRNFEKFTYDPLARLNQAEQQDPLNFYTPVYTNNININEIGNITHKDDAGDYVYGNLAKPFNLTQIVNPTPNVPSNPLQILYNDIRKVKQITDAATNKEMNFTYGNDDQRIKVDYLVSGVNQYSRYYQSNYELEESTQTGVSKEWSYIFAPSGLAAIYYKTGASTGELLYVLNDHLGSPILLTDQNQVIREKYSFDAWGRRRNPDNWSYAGLTPSNYLHRGYTFHEHIDEFALINMNGRVYDPVLGRFIQPDNLVQMPDNLQNFNRYAYCYNNPLSYIDPSGNEIFEAIAAGLMGFYQGWQIGSEKSDNFFVRFGYGMTGGLIASSAAFVGGIVGGAVASYIGVSGFIGGAISGASSGLVSGLIKGTGMSLLSGADPDDAFVNGWKQGGMDALSGAASGGAMEGYKAYKNGERIWQGGYKTYKAEYVSYVSTDNAGTDVYQTPDEYYSAFNTDSKDAYYLLEDPTSSGKPVYGKLRPGEYIKKDIDGVATSKYNDMVFKVPDGGVVIVKSGGNVNLYMSAFDDLKLQGQMLMKPGYQYGWVSSSYFNSGEMEIWGGLFKFAKIIK